MMNGQKVVKVFCHEEESKTEFKKLNEDLFVSADRANTYANFLGPMKLLLNVRKLARPPNVNPPTWLRASAPPTIAHIT